MKKLMHGSKVITKRSVSAFRESDLNPELAKPSQYQSLFQSAAFSIVETDLTGRIIDYNPTFAGMLLANQEDFKASKVVSLIPQKWHDKEESTRAEVIENGVTDEYEIELLKTDGTIVPVAVRKWLQSDPQGNAQGIGMSVRDNTDKKKNDDVVYQRAISLLENQIRYQSLLACVPIGILTVDETTRIDSVNPAVEELLDYTSSEIVGK